MVIWGRWGRCWHPLPGCVDFVGGCSGDVATLNPRLMALIPQGSSHGFGALPHHQPFRHQLPNHATFPVSICLPAAR